MATETGSTNNHQRTTQQAGDGGQAARGGAGSERGQRSAGRERGQALTSAQRGGIGPFSGDLEQSPFASLWQISREMDRLMDAFFGGSLAMGRAGGAPSGESRYARTMWTPQIEVRQREDSMVIHV